MGIVGADVELVLHSSPPDVPNVEVKVYEANDWVGGLITLIILVLSSS